MLLVPITERVPAKFALHLSLRDLDYPIFIGRSSMCDVRLVFDAEPCITSLQLPATVGRHASDKLI